MRKINASGVDMPVNGSSPRHKHPEVIGIGAARLMAIGGLSTDTLGHLREYADSDSVFVVLTTYSVSPYGSEGGAR